MTSIQQKNCEGTLQRPFRSQQFIFQSLNQSLDLQRSQPRLCRHYFSTSGIITRHFYHAEQNYKKISEIRKNGAFIYSQIVKSYYYLIKVMKFVITLKYFMYSKFSSCLTLKHLLLLTYWYSCTIYYIYIKTLLWKKYISIIVTFCTN